MGKLVGVVVSSLVLSGGMCALWACESDKAHHGPSAPSIQNLAGTWTLDSLLGQPFAQLVPQDAAAKRPTLDIRPDGKVSGFAGVNRLTSSLDVEGVKKGQFKLSPAAVTRMAGPAYAMALESKYLDALNKATGFRMEGSSLVLLDGTTEMASFTRS
ncbi:MAG: META domain-containing protein [Phycisphaerales bacterium]|nr:META domain-containing protein [Planctomycetota bacterium]